MSENKETMIPLTQKRYDELITAEVKNNILLDMARTNEYLNKEDIITILGGEEEFKKFKVAEEARKVKENK